LALWAKGNLPQFSILSPLHPKRAYAFSLSDACFYDFFFETKLELPLPPHGSKFSSADCPVTTLKKTSMSGASH
jgi:hypothetical protein